MEQVQMDYSPKNIPFHSEKEYKINLIHKTRKFVRNMKWKAYFYLNPRARTTVSETYGFKSSNNPPHITLMKKFEDGLVDMVQSVKFKQKSNNSSEFQKKLSEDVRKIKSNANVIAKGDKSINFYVIPPQRYQEMVHSNITKEYKIL